MAVRYNEIQLYFDPDGQKIAQNILSDPVPI